MPIVKSRNSRNLQRTCLVVLFSFWRLSRVPPYIVLEGKKDAQFEIVAFACKFDSYVFDSAINYSTPFNLALITFKKTSLLYFSSHYSVHNSHKIILLSSCIIFVVPSCHTHTQLVRLKEIRASMSCFHHVIQFRMSRHCTQ